MLFRTQAVLSTSLRAEYPLNSNNYKKFLANFYCKRQTKDPFSRGFA